MNRIQKIKFINEKILPGAEIADWYWMKYGREVVADILNGITSWRMGKPTDVEMDAKIIDGVLYINSDGVKRVAPKLQNVEYKAEAAYWEGKILAKQGM